MQQLPKVVAVTGASGYIGTRLLMELETNPNIGKIVAFDRKPLPYPIHNISFYHRDIARPNQRDNSQSGQRNREQSVQRDNTPSIESILRQHRVETLVHLACPYSHTTTYQNWAAVSRENLEVLEATRTSCLAAGVKHIIFVSSHSVYGSFADNPMPVAELVPIRNRPNDYLGDVCLFADIAMQEFNLKREEEEHSQLPKITILRTSPVLGYSDDHLRAENIFPYRFWGTGENPPFQFIHEVDLALVLEQVIQRGIEGIFNVAGEGVVFLRELSEITRRKLTQLPVFLAYPAAWMSSRLSNSVDGVWNVNTTRYPIIMSTGKIKQTLGFKFGYTSLEALNAFVNYNGL